MGRSPPVAKIGCDPATVFGVGGEGNELAVVGMDANEVWGLGAAGHNGAS